MGQEIIVRPPVHPAAAERIKKIRELTAATGGSLLPLSSFDGFDEWLNNPITLALLARVESHREAKRDELDKMAPCSSCHQERASVNKEDRGWVAGLADAYDAVAITILSGKQPKCEHVKEAA